MTVSPITVARKESQDVTKRSKRTEELIEIMAGSSSEVVAMQTSHIMNSYDSRQREDILKNFKHTIYVPEDAS